MFPVYPCPGEFQIVAGLLQDPVIPAQAGIPRESVRIIMGLAPPNVVSRLRGNDSIYQ
ncbi:MAG: hypothetical protein LBG45_10195 [Dysgonamonadaceae bacterium]|nr:hypothetical protein [Dysgonamonadaceae bacterium]